MIVLDASAVVALLLQNRAGREVGRHLRRENAVAPAHLEAEVLSTIGRMVRAGDLRPALASQCLANVASMPLWRGPLAPLLQQAWEIRENVALRDALYVALAKRLRTKILTTDGRLARAVPELTVLVGA